MPALGSTIWSASHAPLCYRLLHIMARPAAAKHAHSQLCCRCGILAFDPPLLAQQHPEVGERSAHRASRNVTGRGPHTQRVQMSIMDGNLYDTRFQEAGQELDDDDMEAALLLLNNRQQPLLAPGGGGQHSSTGKVLVQLSVRP